MSTRKEAWPIVVDGSLLWSGQVTLSANSGGFTCGEGLFETLPLVAGRLQFLERHITRFRQSAEALGLQPFPDLSTWLSDLRLLCAASPFDSMTIRLFLVRDLAEVRRVVTASALPEEVGRPVSVGLVAPVFDGPRALAQHKSLNYLVPRLAFREGEGRGLDEVFFRDHDGTILEGTRSSVLIIQGGVLRTAPVSRPILPGVTREVLLQVAAARGIKVSEKSFTVEDLLNAEEVFLSASVRGVRTVQTFEGRPVGRGASTLTDQLRQGYQENALRECAARLLQ